MSETKGELSDRLRENDPELIRLDIGAKILSSFDDQTKNDFMHAVSQNATVLTVHLSCADLEDCLTEEQTAELFDALGKLQNLEELFVFRGNCALAVESLLSKCLEKAKKVKVLMIWDFGAIGDHPALAGSIRAHPALERVTLTLPGGLPYAYLDVYVMGFASMETLSFLSIRCRSRQEEAAISPEALSILASSKAIRSLYLQELGLTDDHSDAIALELQDNKTLELLDLKDNAFSDDALYTFAVTLKKNKTLTSLDLSGTNISPGGGQALADALVENQTIAHLELDGGKERFSDEFAIPVGHRDEPWMQALDFQLRLNRTETKELHATVKRLSLENTALRSREL